MGEWWYLTSPDPDPDVVRGLGKREEIEADEDVVGSGSGTDLFGFEAVGPGTTEIRLIQCPVGACAGGGSRGGPVTPSPSRAAAPPRTRSTAPPSIRTRSRCASHEPRDMNSARWAAAGTRA